MSQNGYGYGYIYIYHSERTRCQQHPFPREAHTFLCRRKMTKPLGVASVQLNTQMIPCQHCSAYAEERLPGPCIAARSFLIVQADHRSPSTTPNSSCGGRGGPEGVFHPLQAFWVWNRRSAAAPYPATSRVTALTHLLSSVHKSKHPIALDQ